MIIFMSWMIFLVGAVICRTLIFYKFWGWFIAPAFGVEPISFLLAMGLTFLINYFTIDIDYEEMEKPNKDHWYILGESIGTYIIVPLLVVLYGWIITLFM